MTAFVYVILVDSGEVKVGLSGTPYARLSKIKREYGPRRNFKDASLVGFVRTAYGQLVESRVQSRLAEHATGGEWYRVDPLIALDAVIDEARALEDDPLVIRPSEAAAAA